MRQIKYILINDSVPEVTPGMSGNYTVSNFGHHYIINSQGMVLNPIDIHQSGNFMPKSVAGQEDLNQCSIGIKYNGTLKRGTCNLKLRALLISLLLDLRDRFPDAKILGLSEIELGTRNMEPGTRGRIRPSDSMNALRRELSDYP